MNVFAGRIKINGNAVDASPGFIMRDKAIGGLTSYFLTQKR
jgi:hypothetical protein